MRSVAYGFLLALSMAALIGLFLVPVPSAQAHIQREYWILLQGTNIFGWVMIEHKLTERWWTHLGYIPEYWDPGVTYIYAAPGWGATLLQEDTWISKQSRVQEITARSYVKFCLLGFLGACIQEVHSDRYIVADGNGGAQGF